MRIPPHEIGRLWASDWSLSALLALLATLIFIVHPLISLGYELAWLASAVFSLALLSGVMAVAHTRAARAGLGGLALLAVTVHWARYTQLGPAWASADAVATFTASAMLATIVFIQVFRPGPITAHRIQGALAGYLLIAMVFATVYVWIDLRHPDAFTGGATQLLTEHEARAARLGYFSLTTLTTVGYGDIVAVHPIARSLATLEAVIGQIFPAVLLARLVSLEIAERQRRRAEGDRR